MLNISVSGYFDELNDFLIKEIYVSNESELYVLRKSDMYIPTLYPGNVMSLFDSLKNSYYPLISMSSPRVYEDDDPKSLATFLMQKIHDVHDASGSFDKTLFDVISSLGMENKK